MIRVVVADDHALVRGGFRMILEAQPDIEVAGEAANGLEAVELARGLAPDVVLMDVRMPELDGIEATRRVTASAGEGPRVLMLTTFDLDEYVYRAIRAGASGFLLKDVRPAELVHAVRVVSSGDTLLAPPITRRLVEEFVRRPLHGQRPNELDGLTVREFRSTRAGRPRPLQRRDHPRLFLAETTVKTHVTRILTKLGLRDRVQAVVLAYESGLVRPGDDTPEARPLRLNLTGPKGSHAAMSRRRSSAAPASRAALAWSASTSIAVGCPSRWARPGKPTVRVRACHAPAPRTAVWPDRGRGARPRSGPPCSCSRTPRPPTSSPRSRPCTRRRRLALARDRPPPYRPRRRGPRHGRPARAGPAPTRLAHPPMTPADHQPAV